MKKLKKLKKIKNKYDFSIIVPAFNAANSIANTIESFSEQNYDNKRYELILVNDGSKDNTLNVLYDLKSRFNELNINIIDKSNGGVSSARNAGIKKSEGKYLIFLDADDSLGVDTLKNIFIFFEKNHDEIDVATYDLVYKKSGKKHYRSDFFKESCIVDSSDIRGITLTTINFCIKNRFSLNEYFNENLFMHEDEEYAARLILKKGKFGYVKGAEYFYDNRNNLSATATKLNPYHSFDKSMGMYENLCRLYSKDGKVDRYIQNLIINDFSWKIRSNVLLNVDSDSVKFNRDIKRVSSLIDILDDELILNHPNTDKYHKHYFLSLKKKRPTIVKNGERILLNLSDDSQIHVKENNIYISDIKFSKNNIVLSGFLKNYISNYIERGEIGLYYSDGFDFKKIKTKFTYYSYHRSKLKTNDFNGFELHLDPKIFLNKEIRFFTSFKDSVYPIRSFSFAPDSNFGRNLCKFSNEYCIYFDKEKSAFIVKKGFERLKLLSSDLTSRINKNPGKSILAMFAKSYSYSKIWIYCDRDGLFDNSFYQFKDDLKRNDSIKRYYICHNELDMEKVVAQGIPRRNILRSKSLQHKVAFLKSEYVFTSFVDDSFYLPFGRKNYYNNYSNKFSPKIIYMQHGVLHAHTIHYAKEFLGIDKIVISTKIERELYLKLGFSEDQLLPFGMPRLSSNEKNVFHLGKIRKIIYLPSWRSYLAARSENNTWSFDKAKMSRSNFWLGISDLLKDNFVNFLKSKDALLDIGLHPIFRGAEKEFIENDRVKFVESFNINDYDLVVTDFSSVIYDAVYLGKPIMYYCPDYDEINGGLNLYSKISTPMENGFGLFSRNINELSKSLKLYFDDADGVSKKFSKKYEECFYDFSSSSDLIYKKISIN
ncbi:glycosyltransferase [Comamonas thiooxydans]|uniref:glycosyltransferase n=1 Tax=Comamonas thiooxydans TaxID=363952 RepID=UPI0006A8BE83|nr:glycosyltransferase [Comamonas thiooxydans]CUA96222.1 Glycosyl transferase family 2/CDP-Glycerol:Poly(glycerophosphate) glycerophosphotransferase [Comamonas thiooxydans]